MVYSELVAATEKRRHEIEHGIEIMNAEEKQRVRNLQLRLNGNTHRVLSHHALGHIISLDCQWRCYS
jgi:hypothetical protein